MRCTQATLEALGIRGICPLTGGGVLEALADNGFRYQPLTGTLGLADFVSQNQTGKFYLFSAGHAMALVEGRLTDTSGRKVTNRIKVQAYRVS